MFTAKFGVLQMFFMYSVTTSFQPWNLKFQRFSVQFHNLLGLNHSCSIQLQFTLNISYIQQLSKTYWIKEHFKFVSVFAITSEAHLILSVTLSNFKVVENDSLKCKTRTYTRCKAGSIKVQLKSNCYTFRNCSF